MQGVLIKLRPQDIPQKCGGRTRKKCINDRCLEIFRIMWFSCINFVLQHVGGNIKYIADLSMYE